jgi:hypothetical protein
VRKALKSGNDICSSGAAQNLKRVLYIPTINKHIKQML